MANLSQKLSSDDLGYISSTLCLIHCICTPFIFITQCYLSGCYSGSPILWRSLDYVFLIISFFAMQSTVKTSPLKWIQYSLIISWGSLATIKVLEVTGFIIGHYLAEISAFFLIILHLYNRRYCKCQTGCCSDKPNE